MRTFPRSLVGAVAGACLAASCSTPPSPSSNPPPTLGFIHVVHPGSGVPYLADPAGRRVILRGVAASGFEDQAYSGAVGTTPHFPVDPAAYQGRCPVNDRRAPDPPLCEVEASLPAGSQASGVGSQDDFAQMHRFGFNLVRLTLSWSLLEPSPGRYSTTYLNRIAQVVGWAAQQGIYVILDMHEDQYSRFLASAASSTPDPTGCTPSNGQDGAPEWAVVTDGQPSCALFGQNELNPAMAAAFQNFWDNSSLGAGGKPLPQGAAPGPGLEDHYIGALAQLAQRFSRNSTVLGYEIINEPLPGAAPGSPLPLSNLYTFSDRDLYPFYRRAVEALTGVRDGDPSCPSRTPSGPLQATGPSRPAAGNSLCAYPALAHVSQQEIFVEPTGYTNLVDFAPQASSPFTTYPNLVFSPHVYTHVFTADSFAGGGGRAPGGSGGAATTYPPSYTFGYATAESEARAMHAALLVTEYGDSPSDDTTVLAGMTAAQERSLSGSVFWTWKENCGGGNGHCSNGWGVYQPPAPGSQNGPLSPSRVEYLQRAWPVETAGTLLDYAYDPMSHSLVMSATAASAEHRGDRAAETVVFLPPSTTGPVRVSGAALLDGVTREPGGSRLAYVAPTGAGEYRVQALGFPDDPAHATENSSASAELDRLESQGTLQPVGEVQARSIFDAWVQQANSPIVSVVESLILGPPGQDPNR